MLGGLSGVSSDDTAGRRHSDLAATGFRPHRILAVTFG
jgi:hypothetical protein